MSNSSFCNLAALLNTRKRLFLNPSDGGCREEDGGVPLTNIMAESIIIHMKMFL